MKLSNANSTVLNVPTRIKYMGNTFYVLKTVLFIFFTSLRKAKQGSNKALDKTEVEWESSYKPNQGAIQQNKKPKTQWLQNLHTNIKKLHKHLALQSKVPMGQKHKEKSITNICIPLISVF